MIAVGIQISGNQQSREQGAGTPAVTVQAGPGDLQQIDLQCALVELACRVRGLNAMQYHEMSDALGCTVSMTLQSADSAGARGSSRPEAAKQNKGRVTLRPVSCF